MVLRGTIRHLRKRLTSGSVSEPPYKFPRMFTYSNSRFYHTPPGYCSEEEAHPKPPFTSNSTNGRDRIWKHKDQTRTDALSSSLDVSENSVEVRTNIPIFGSGLFATKDLEVGETVVEETPFLRFNWSGLCSGADRKNLVRRYRLQKVQPEWRAMAACIVQAFAYAGRGNCINPLELKEFQVLVATRRATKELSDVLETEILPVVQSRFNSSFSHSQLLELYSKIASNAYRNGLYCTISKINHSCHPNTCWKPSQSGFGPILLSGRTIVATVPIAKGDQLFISYGDSDGFDISLLGELGIRCQNNPEDFEATSQCACFVGRDLSVARRIFNIST